MMTPQANPSNPNPDPRQTIEAWQEVFNAELQKVLDAGDASPGKLLESMRYSTLDGGKRIRPMLVYASGLALGVPVSSLHAIALAIEIIHT